jgi:hypothetical protein
MGRGVGAFVAELVRGESITAIDTERGRPTLWI